MRYADEHLNAVIRRIKSKGDFQRANGCTDFCASIRSWLFASSRIPRLSNTEARTQLGVSRAVFDTWKVRLDKLMWEGERP